MRWTRGDGSAPTWGSASAHAGKSSGAETAGEPPDTSPPARLRGCERCSSHAESRRNHVKTSVAHLNGECSRLTGLKGVGWEPRLIGGRCRDAKEKGASPAEVHQHSGGEERPRAI